MEKQRMNVFQILRATQRLNSPQLRGLQVVAWSCRIISGVFQGFGLLALIQLATALASGEPAGGLSVMADLLRGCGRSRCGGDFPARPLWVPQRFRGDETGP